jgi:hypothetical protein
VTREEDLGQAQGVPQALVVEVDDRPAGHRFGNLAEQKEGRVRLLVEAHSSVTSA